MPTGDYVPRLTIELTERQARKLSELVPYGLKKPLFQILVEDLITALEEGNEMALAMLLKRHLKLNTLKEDR
jgi:hypothetical protein